MGRTHLAKARWAQEASCRFETPSPCVTEAKFWGHYLHKSADIAPSHWRCYVIYGFFYFLLCTVRSSCFVWSTLALRSVTFLSFLMTCCFITLVCTVVISGLLKTYFIYAKISLHADDFFQNPSARKCAPLQCTCYRRSSVADDPAALTIRSVMLDHRGEISWMYGTLHMC
jgi:hypothetical protein